MSFSVVTTERSRTRLARRSRLLAGALGLFLGTAGCVFSCEADTVPDPLTCTNAPSGAELTELSLATGPSDPAVPVEEGAPTYVVVDLEGRLLVSLRVIWQGPAAPACGQVELRVRHPETGVELDGESVQLLSSPSPSGRVSGEIYFVADMWPAHVDVEVEAYGLSFTRRVQVGGFGSSDGGASDAGQLDSGVLDAGSGDAGPGDSGSLDSGPTDADSGPADAGPADSGPADSGPADSGVADSGVADSGPPDAG